jgi:hypothetical protein
MLPGAAISFLAPDAEKDPAAIAATIAHDRVTTMHFVPSMLQVFLQYGEVQPALVTQLRSLRYIFASGEALPASLVSRFYALLQPACPVRLINLYGPTEAAIDVSAFDCPAGQALSAVPIGAPIANIRLYILDAQGRPQPIGVPGELAIAGVGLARGYLGRPGLTAQSFVPNPFRPGERLYRTGDLARWLPDGLIAYLGRRDHQVKLRGFRIELGEVEAALLTHPQVAEAVVLVREVGSGERALCAYVATREPLEVDAVREYLAGMLPSYMMPAHITLLERLPLLGNGKVDRKALLALETTVHSAAPYEAPESAVERALAAIWMDLLGADSVSIHDNFFELGGHSLLLLRAHERLEILYPGVVKVTDLFANPTIAKLASYIEATRRASQQDLSLRYIELPAAFFSRGASQREVPVLRFQLDVEVTRTFERITDDLGIGMGQILLAVYVYLFAQLTKRVELALQAALNGADVVPLDLSLQGIDGVASLLEATARATPEAGQEDRGYSLAQRTGQKQHRPSPLAIAPLFYLRDTLLQQAGLTDTYDLTLSYQQRDQQITLWCEFNPAVLARERVRDFVAGYQKLARWLAAQSGLVVRQTVP